MHKIVLENEDIVLDSDNIFDIEEERNVVIYLHGSGNVTFNLGKNAKVLVYHLGIDISNVVIINLDGENAEVLYNYEVINYIDDKMKIIVNHNQNNTISNIYNHGVNVLDNKLSFDVSGVVPKDIKGCICNQENRIININDGKSTICPNLLIDSYDIISSHAAYIGRFSDEVLFYLMSRGITKKKAYELLVASFLLPDGIDKDKIKDFILELQKI